MESLSISKKVKVDDIPTEEEKKVIEEKKIEKLLEDMRQEHERTTDRKIEDQKKTHLEEIEALKKELDTLRRKEQQKKTTTDTDNTELVPTQNEGSPAVNPQGVTVVNEENADRVSKEYKGLLRNDNGSYEVTPQFRTWSQNTQVQLRDTYSFIPNMPPEAPVTPHPEPTDLNLKWSHEGGWGQIAVNINGKEVLIPIRIERYVDLEGNIKQAVAYGEEAEKLKVWFRIEDILATYKNWTLPSVNPFFNSKRFNPDSKRKDQLTKSSSMPRDQSLGDIQGSQIPPKYPLEVEEEGEEGEEVLGPITVEIGPKPTRSGTWSSLATPGNQQNHKKRPGKTTTQ